MYHTHTRLFFVTAVAALVAAAFVPARPAHGAVGRENFLSDGEQQFVNQAWGLSSAQISLGGDVEHQAANSDVKAFGERMVAYHTVFNGQLKVLADQYRGSVPDQLDAGGQRALDRLSGLKGAEFDREYMRAAIDALTQSVALFERQSKDVAETPLDNWAGGVVPELRRELQVAERIGRDLGMPSSPDDGAIAASHQEPAKGR